MKAVSFSSQLSIVLTTTAHKVKPAFVLRSKWLNIRNFLRDMLLVISSFLLQYVMVFVMELTKKISLPGKRKGKHICLSVTTLYRVYQSFLLLVIDSFSRHLFDDFCKRHKVHSKLIGAEGEPYTGNNGGLNNSHTRRVKCIIFHFRSEIIYLLLLCPSLTELKHVKKSALTLKSSAEFMTKWWKSLLCFYWK